MNTARTTTSDIARNSRIARLTLDEQQAVVAYKRALRSKLEAARALRTARTPSARDAAYAAMDAFQTESRRCLNVLNESLTLDLV